MLIVAGTMHVLTMLPLSMGMCVAQLRCEYECLSPFFPFRILIMYAVGFVIVIFQKVRNRFAAKRCSSSFVCLFIFAVTCVAYVSFTVGKFEKKRPRFVHICFFLSLRSF